MDDRARTDAVLDHMSKVTRERDAIATDRARLLAVVAVLRGISTAEAALTYLGDAGMADNTGQTAAHGPESVAGYPSRSRPALGPL